MLSLLAHGVTAGLKWAKYVTAISKWILYINDNIPNPFDDVYIYIYMYRMFYDFRA